MYYYIMFTIVTDTRMSLSEFFMLQNNVVRQSFSIVFDCLKPVLLRRSFGKDYSEMSHDFKPTL